MARGGKRPGAGRRKGQKSAATIEREAALRLLQNRIARHADDLFNAQFTLARGCQLLYRAPKKGGKHVLVTSPETIRQFLDGELQTEDYVYLATERPNNFAISDMLDRSFGKPPAAIAVSAPDGGPVHIHHHFSAGT